MNFIVSNIISCLNLSLLITMVILLYSWFLMWVFMNFFGVKIFEFGFSNDRNLSWFPYQNLISWLIDFNSSTKQGYLRQQATQRLQELLEVATSLGTAGSLWAAAMRPFRMGRFCPLPTWGYSVFQNLELQQSILGLIQCLGKEGLERCLKAGLMRRLRENMGVGLWLLSKNWILRACKVLRNGRWFIFPWGLLS